MKKLWIAVLLFLCLPVLAGTGWALSDDEIAGQCAEAAYGTEDNRYLSAEVSVGSLAADGALYASGADIAIVNSGDLGRNLPGGTVTYEDCRVVFMEDRTLAVVTVSPAELRDLLEVGVSRIVMDDEQMTDREASAWGGFPQIGGFEFEYDVSSLPGGRIRWIRINGEKLDLTDNTPGLTLCATGYMLQGGWDYPVSGGEDLETTLSEALFSYIQARGTVSPPGTGERIIAVGSKDEALLDAMHISPVLLLVAVLLFGTVRSRRFKKYYDFER